MARLFDADSTLKRLRNRYRLVVMNDDTFEEVVTFKLSRMSVYITLCTIFVLLVGLTVALITFTNLKYYLPGYGTQSQRKELIFYKTKIDSLEKSMLYKDQYLDNLKKVLSGNVESKVDTATLQLPEVEKSTQ
jgi:predicted PurR-regulated permease PerM